MTLTEALKARRVRVQELMAREGMTRGEAEAWVSAYETQHTYQSAAKLRERRAILQAVRPC